MAHTAGLDSRPNPFLLPTTTPPHSIPKGASGKPNFGSVGRITAEADLRSEINKRESSLEDGSRFLESLMGGSAGGGMPGGKLPFSEGGVVPSGEVGNNSYLLAQKMALDRQRSASDNLHWLGKEAALAVPSSGIIQDPLTFHKILKPRMADTTLSPYAQNSDLNPVMQGLRERSSSLINNNVAARLSSTGQGSLRENIDFQHAQFLAQASLGIQQQRLPSSLTNLLTQPTDNSIANVNPELLLSSGISQDPQVLALLQQQYLMQMQTQPQVPSLQL
ncbi:hypothetical protein MLD38_002094 [Melastoma candidum]|uniref:Uncharacterized protein n=1 Tax=Melastoma candidum TaxID=119954 RepID=A0ACB9SGM6_9MYRT|nr:hypothetical protein MLD38_002094 [Melastoma candidum]